MIIWIGLTDHAACPNEPFYDMDVEKKYYISIANLDLCRQYYTRLLQQPVESIDWLNIPSSADVGCTLEMERRHRLHGYCMKTQSEILEIFKTQISNLEI